MSPQSCTRKWPRATVLALAAVVLGAATAFAAGELVKNGLFARGTGDAPEGWSHDGYVQEAGTTQFSWAIDPKSQIGVIKIDSVKPNDARWTQNVPVSPSTWYRISGWVKTDNVGTGAIGAYLSVMNTFNNSAEMRGTQDWQPVSLWIKTSGLETTLPVACRLGGYGALNTGSASFTGISVEAAGTPTSDQGFVYGGSPNEAPSHRPLLMQGIAALVAIGIALLLWRYLMPPSASIPP